MGFALPATSSVTTPTRATAANSQPLPSEGSKSCPGSSQHPSRAAWARSLIHLAQADAIGSYWGNPKTRTFAELLIDCEEDRTLRAVLVGIAEGA
jgi:hypothetical protein